MIDLEDDTPLTERPEKIVADLGMPPLPEIDTKNCIGYEHIRYVPGYTDDFCKRYAIAYAREVLKAKGIA